MNPGKYPTSWVVIPARLHSQRLPRKLLLRETGKSVLQHTFESVSQARLPARICVATDHEEIRHEAESFGAAVVMTSPFARSGTDRVAEVARSLDGVDVVVNVQGDEPELAPAAVDQLIRLLHQHPQVPMATLATPIRQLEHLLDPACVKLVRDRRGRALAFSRSPIPYARDGYESWLRHEPPVFWQHLGVYAYRRDFLLRLAELPPSPWEEVERLEQLRVLAAGYEIQVGVVSHSSRGIDTPDDYRQFVLRWAS